MKVIVAGGRNFVDYKLMKVYLDAWLNKRPNVTIVSGCAKGADILGERYAQEAGHSLLRMPAAWNKYGKAAGHIRNASMAKVADALVAFWDGESKGTSHMILVARKAGLLYKVVKYE